MNTRPPDQPPEPPAAGLSVVPGVDPTDEKSASPGQPRTKRHLTLVSQSPPERPSLARELFEALPRPVRWLSYLAVGMVLVMLALAAAAASFYSRPLPQIEGQVEVAGLSAPVDVLRDEYGVAQLYADTDEDLMRAQGYVSAQERFFEMDLRRHLTSGRLSELFGSRTLDSDKFIRTLGWRRVAEREVGLLSPDTRRLLEAYADGVNAWLRERDTSQLAVEYSVLALGGLDYYPEPWTSADSVAWLKAMAWDLRSNMQNEIDRVVASLDHSPAEIAELYPAYDLAEHPSVVTGGGVIDGVFEPNATRNGTRKPKRPPLSPAAVRALERARQAAATVPESIGIGDSVGSNAFVVSAQRSATGAPLLAADPHLAMSQPGVWMPIGLHCRERAADCTLDVSGFTFAGLPGVLLGHNADIAWGLTNLQADTSDLFLERISSAGWRYDGEWRPLTLRHETIKVRDEPDFDLQIRSTAHGPLISDVSSLLSSVGANAPVPPEAEAEGGTEPFAVALRWTALDPHPSADAIFALNRAGDWAAFREAAGLLAVPSQNLVYADRAGHIGYQAAGQIPIRQSGNDGMMPAAGWRAENDWTGEYVPADALPQVLDPAAGYLVSANNAVTGATYPYYLGADIDRGFRASRITELIEAETDLSLEEVAAIQTDTAEPLAATLVPRLLEVELPHGYYSQGQRLLVDWDQRNDPDSAAAAYFQVVWKNLLNLTFADDLRRSIAPSGGSRWVAVMETLLADPTSKWWDDHNTEDEVESRDDILRVAQLSARDELTRLLSRSPAGWRWGSLHRLDLRHQALGSTGTGFLDPIFNRSDKITGGASSSVVAFGFDAAANYRVTTGPTMRMIVSLSDFDESRWINLTGVSGHPASSHYDDQTEDFLAGATLPWAFSQDSVQESSLHTLVLTPLAEREGPGE